MEFRHAGPLRVHVVADATLPDPGHFPRIIRVAHEIWKAGTGVTTRVDDVDRFVLIRAGHAEVTGVGDAGLDGAGAEAPPLCTHAGTAVLVAAGGRLRLRAADDENLTLSIVTARAPGFRQRLRSDPSPGTAVRRLRSFAEAEALLDGCLLHAAAGDVLEQRTATAYFQTFLSLLSSELTAPQP
ncbi:MAG: hypothetical protein ACOC2D_08575, partial [Spirochaetota bacterium]